MIQPKIVVLNLDERPDRLDQVGAELDRLGWTWERFAAVKGTPGWTGYNQSIAALFEQYKDEEYLLLVEDDAVFARDMQPYYRAIEQLPEGWDALWLGSNLQKYHRRRVADHLYAMENGWCTHALLMTKAFRQWCMANWKPTDIVFDEWLRTVAQPQRHCYVVKPMVALQRPSWSNIENKYADYSECWSRAQKMLL